MTLSTTKNDSLDIMVDALGIEIRYNNQGYCTMQYLSIIQIRS